MLQNSSHDYFKTVTGSGKSVLNKRRAMLVRNDAQVRQGKHNEAKARWGSSASRTTRQASRRSLRVLRLPGPKAMDIFWIVIPSFGPRSGHGEDAGRPPFPLRMGTAGVRLGRSGSWPHRLPLLSRTLKGGTGWVTTLPADNVAPWKYMWKFFRSGTIPGQKAVLSKEKGLHAGGAFRM